MSLTIPRAVLAPYIDKSRYLQDQLGQNFMRDSFNFDVTTIAAEDMFSYLIRSLDNGGTEEEIIAQLVLIQLYTRKFIVSHDWSADQLWMELPELRNWIPGVVVAGGAMIRYTFPQRASLDHVHKLELVGKPQLFEHPHDAGRARVRVMVESEIRRVAHV